MRSPSAKYNIYLSVLLLFTFGLLSSLVSKPKIPKHLYGTWQYIAVERNGKSVFSIGESDTMNLQKDGRFNYAIVAPGKTARGSWKLIEVPKDSSAFKKALEFTYLPAGNRRIFHICAWKKDLLCIREGNLFFRYKRR